MFCSYPSAYLRRSLKSVVTSSIRLRKRCARADAFGPLTCAYSSDSATSVPTEHDDSTKSASGERLTGTSNAPARRWQGRASVAKSTNGESDRGIMATMSTTERVKMRWRNRPDDSSSAANTRPEGAPSPRAPARARSAQAGSSTNSERPIQEAWGVQKEALRTKFGSEAWNPRKRLSPDALAGIRAVHAQFPQEYTTAKLAEKFQVSPEMIRRILKSKWRPDESAEEDRMQRWIKRGESIWKTYAEKGMKVPSKWRELGVEQKNGRKDFEPSYRMLGRGDGFRKINLGTNSYEEMYDEPALEDETEDQPLTTERRNVAGLPWISGSSFI